MKGYDLKFRRKVRNGTLFFTSFQREISHRQDVGLCQILVETDLEDSST